MYAVGHWLFNHNIFFNILKSKNMTKTQLDIEQLKQDWLNDPCWDIESTEGFEDYEIELKEWSDKIKQRMREKENKRLEEKSNSLGVSIAALQYIEKLEIQLEYLQTEIEKLKYPS